MNKVILSMKDKWHIKKLKKEKKFKYDEHGRIE